MNFNKRKIFIPLFVLTIIFLISSIGLAQDFPLTVTDDLDQEIEMNKKPEKIISISPNMTEVLFAIGAGENVVGVTTFANYPKEATKVDKIGTITEPNIEKIVSMEPDLVIASSVNKKETVDRLRELGVNVAGFNANSVNQAIEIIKNISTLTGYQENGEKITAEMYIKISEIRDLVDEKLNNNERPKVFYEIWSEPLFTAGGNNFIDDLIHMAGGFNIGRLADGPWPQYNLEKLLIEDPDVYISTPHSAEMEVSKEQIKNRERFQSIGAIQNDRVYIIHQDILNRPSPRLVQGLGLLTKAIFPELTEEVNVILD